MLYFRFFETYLLKIYYINQGIFKHFSTSSLDFVLQRKLNAQPQKCQLQLNRQVHLRAYKEKQHDTSSDSSLDIQSNKNSVKKQNNSTKFTSLDKVSSYFQFFIETPNQKSQKSYQIKNSIYAADTQIDKFLIINLIEKLQKKQLQKNEGKNQEVLLDFQTKKQIQNCQRSTHQQVQSKLLASKRFKKQKSFTSEILVHQIQSSKHTQITTLEIQLLQYKTSITILNQLDKAPQRFLTHTSCSGSFGFVYLLGFYNRQFAIKSIPFKKNVIEQKNKIINTKHYQDFHFVKIQAIKEYFYLLLFSQLQIGPQVRNIGGFDLVIYEDSIEFATEICSSLHATEDKLQDLKQSLFQMHMLQIVHRDIKPSNIMFSPTFNKNVFIDFGGTQALNEKVGEKTVTHFVGTASYCSNEVFLLLSQRGIAVDLYYNDVFGLRKFLNQVTLQIINSSSNYSNTIKSETLRIHQMDQSQYFSYQFINLRYLLYSENYEIFDEQWRSLFIIQNHEQALIWERNIVSFLKEMKPNNYLREFYWNYISQEIRDLPQFKGLGQVFENQNNELLYYLSSDIEKKQLYVFHIRFYKFFEIDYGNSTTEEKQILRCLIDQQSIKQSIAYLSKKISTSLMETSDIWKLCLIIAHYCSVSSNIYKITIEQKIRICQQTLSIIEQHETSSFNNIILIFKCPNQALNLINTFYHYFIQRVFRKIPYKFRSQLMVKAVSSLCLLGLPTNNNRMGIEYLLHQLIKQDDQNENNSHFILKPNDFDNQIKMEKILLFWECKVVLLLFQDIFYNRNKTKSLMQHDQEELKRMNLVTMNLMQSKDNQENQFYKLNFRFFEIFIFRINDVNEKNSSEICQILMSPALMNLESSSKIISKWKQLMWISLHAFSMAYRVKIPSKLTKKIQNQLTSKFHFDETILMYLIVCCFYQFSQPLLTIQPILKTIDKIIGSQEISLRFKLEMRFSNSLQKKDFEELKQLCSFIQRQIDYSSISQENFQFLKKILFIIYEFFIQQLQSLPNLNNEFKDLMEMCYEMIKLGIEIGINYFQQKCGKSIFLLFSRVKNDQDSKVINFTEIVKEINDMKLVKNFALALVFAGQTYNNITQIVHKKSSSQRKLIKKMDQKYYLFLSELKQNERVMDYSSLWMSLLSQNQYLINSIKSDRTSSIYIAYLFIEQRKNRQQVMLSHQIIEKIFGEISINKFKPSSQSKSSVFPTFEIAFDYFQVKLLKTNYDPYWCNQLIKLYKIYSNQDQLKSILFQDSLIRFLFNSYIYTEKSYTQIENFLQNLTEIIRKTVTNKIILSVNKIFSDLFSCLCKNCFPRQPPPSWDPYKFTKHLFQTLKLEKANQNPYMSLVYYYSMRKKVLSSQMSRKFIIFMLKSLQYLPRSVKELIISEIYHFAFQISRPQQNSPLMDKKPLKQQKIQKVPQDKMNDKKQRKFIYLYCQFMKHQQERVDLIEDLIEKRLIKQYYIRGFKYPKYIKKLLVKKLRRYHQVRQNCKQVKKLTEFTKSHILEQRLSLMS